MKTGISTESNASANFPHTIGSDSGTSVSVGKPAQATGWQTSKLNSNNLDFCRFWLAILVIFSHSFTLSEGHQWNEPLGILTLGQINLGQFALRCFFAISGFLISHSWLHSKSTISFLKKRVFRIYPGFVVASLLGFFVVAPFANEHFNLTMRSILALPPNLLALRNMELPGSFANNPYPNKINDSLWSIPYEFKCYLGLMVLGCLGLLTKQKRLMTLVLGVTVVGGAIYPLAPVGALDRGAFCAIFGSPLAWSPILPYFVAGMTFYLYSEQIPFSGVLAAVGLVAFAIAAKIPPAGVFVFPFAITYCLFWFAFHPSIRFHTWSRYGDFSYGIYLFAFPIQQLIAWKLPGTSPIFIFLIAAPLSVISGVLSWHLVEKRFLVRTRRTHPEALNELQRTEQLHADRHSPASTARSSANDRNELAVVRGSRVSDHLNLIRGLAALGVLIAHVRFLFLVDYVDLDSTSVGMKAFYFLTGRGHQLVMVFFVMSGYFISSSILNDIRTKKWTWGRYLTSRLVRLYIVLIPALVLTGGLDLAGITCSNHHPVYHGEGKKALIFYNVVDRLDFATFAGNVLFLQNLVVDTFGTNGPLWSLSCEFWYYLLFPCFCLMANRSSSIFNRICHAIVGSGLLIAFWPLMDLFPVWLLGALLPLAPRIGILDRPRYRLASLMITANGFCVSLLFAVFQAIPPLISDYIVGVAFAAFMFVLLHCPVSQSQKWYSILASELAGMSYSLYLVHQPLLVFFVAAFGIQDRWQPVFSVLLLLICVTSVAFIFAFGFAKVTEANTDRCRKWVSQFGSRVKQRAVGEFVSG